MQTDQLESSNKSHASPELYCGNHFAYSFITSILSRLPWPLLQPLCGGPSGAGRGLLRRRGRAAQNPSPPAGTGQARSRRRTLGRPSQARPLPESSRAGRTPQSARPLIIATEGFVTGAADTVIAPSPGSPGSLLVATWFHLAAPSACRRHPLRPDMPDCGMPVGTARDALHAPHDCPAPFQSTVPSWSGEGVDDFSDNRYLGAFIMIHQLVNTCHSTPCIV